MVDDTSQDILNKIVLNLSHYKKETIMVLGDSKDPFCRFLENNGFKLYVEDYSFVIKNRDIDINEFNDCFSKLNIRNDIGFVLALDGGRSANLAKLISLKMFYKENILDFFKREVDPYHVLPFGIILSSSFNGYETSNQVEIEDRKHHFIHTLSSNDLNPSFVYVRGNSQLNLENRISLYLNSGNESFLNNISIDEAFKIYSFNSNFNQSLSVIKKLSKIINSKIIESGFIESVYSSLDFIKPCIEKEKLMDLLSKSITTKLELPEVLKTKLKNKA